MIELVTDQLFMQRTTNNNAATQWMHHNDGLGPVQYLGDYSNQYIYVGLEIIFLLQYKASSHTNNVLLVAFSQIAKKLLYFDFWIWIPLIIVGIEN